MCVVVYIMNHWYNYNILGIGDYLPNPSDALVWSHKSC